MGDVMKKYLIPLIGFLAMAGISLNVMISAFETPYSLMRGLSLFRYYTLQSNLIVGVYFLLLGSKVLNKYDIFNRFFGGVTIYITITFVVFAIFLQGTYHPTGLQGVVNIVSHYIVPILAILYFVIIKNELTFKRLDMLWWIIYPLIYIIFMVIYGGITGDYLYPFFQVSEIGVNGLILTIVLLVGFFMGLSFLLMKIVSKKEITNH